MIFNLEKRLGWLEAKLRKGLIKLKMPDGTIEVIPDDGKALLDALLQGESNPIYKKVAQSIESSGRAGFISLIKARAHGPISREGVEAGESTQSGEKKG